MLKEPSATVVPMCHACKENGLTKTIVSHCPIYTHLKDY